LEHHLAALLHSSHLFNRHFPIQGWYLNYVSTICTLNEFLFTLFRDISSNSSWSSCSTDEDRSGNVLSKNCGSVATHQSIGCCLPSHGTVAAVTTTAAATSAFASVSAATTGGSVGSSASASATASASASGSMASSGAVLRLTVSRGLSGGMIMLTAKLGLW
jgi:hypothetical protein